MRKPNCKALVEVAVLLFASCAYAQNSAPPAYLNPSLPPEQRAADLVHRMTVEEKVSQLTNQSRAIERLHIPAYNWWSEALHGVASSGTTEFPEPVGLASTFDTDAIHRMAIAIGIEARIKRAQFERAGHSRAQEGLDFWAPNINIFRDPRWGRGQETFGEDPFRARAWAWPTSPECRAMIRNTIALFPRPSTTPSTAGPSRRATPPHQSQQAPTNWTPIRPLFGPRSPKARLARSWSAYNSVNGSPRASTSFCSRTSCGANGIQGYGGL